MWNIKHRDFRARVSCVVILSRAKDLPLAVASHEALSVIATPIVRFLASLGMTARGDLSGQID